MWKSPPRDAGAVERPEAESDTRVFRLHGLTPEETALIQDTAKK